ncbi:apolipoprotein N-acyltransferase [Candidatus Thiothrix anitrata]|uniref:Apolipoprotein N-acyltransferase n=1 Tax=Candidatus Thiothrix anitrata TaxID=2823902 RepID=A0ABX7WZQ0_9GAMM|nr:apolipoprotein N-acyltransferase [Candidatus Thiothrix anitrata]QTR48906.1 apolipoprotein N-acyltransferase [Candidatus Thiothrix anitrata]
MLSFHDSLKKVDYLLALLAGASMVLAFAPFELRAFAWFAPAVLFWLSLKNISRGQRLRLAWVFGIGLFAGGAHWIYVSIHFFGGANSFIAALMVLLFVLFVSLPLMLFGWLTSYTQHLPVVWRLLGIFPAAWVLTEWFRGWILTGFPWLQLGITQVDTWLVNYAPITGVLGVSWLVALGAGIILVLVLGSVRERVLVTVLALVMAGGGYGLGLVHWTKAAGEPLYVSMLQGNVDQLSKWDAAFRNENVQAYLDLMDQDKYPDVAQSHLVIWPETALSDYFHFSKDDVMLPLQQWAKDAEAELLVGGFFHDAETESVYNAIMAIGGKYDVETSLKTADGVYGKRHLVPFSEYIPLLDYLRFLENIVKLPYDNVTPWKGGHTLTVAGQPMRMSVCYEDAYAEEMIEGLPEATMLVNVSNDGWFTGSIEPQQHAELARMRAVETGRFLLRATNNGVSAIINEKGQVLNTMPQYQSGVVSGYAMPLSGATPYVEVGNWLVIVTMLLLFLIPLVGFRGKFV